MDLGQMQARAVEVSEKYRAKNQADGNKTWDASAHMAGFVADIGELSELIMAKSNYRNAENVDAKIAHELSDCLYSIFVLANELNVDLEASFEKTMEELDARLA